ncbi:MAG: lysozyme inhibitor LprI family protein [Xylophilus ampelinus]
MDPSHAFTRSARTSGRLAPPPGPFGACGTRPGTARGPRAQALAGLLLLAACIAAAPGPARAQAGADCDPAGTQQQMDACAVRDFQAADSRLNIRYRERMESLPQEGRTALRQEQRAWLRARDPGCKEQVRRHEGGSAWPLAFYACLEQATRNRTGELERWREAARPGR